MKNKYLKVFGIILAILILPLVSAYRLNIPMPSLWDAFVEYGFGGFGITILILMLLFTIILTIGGISFWTIILYNTIFFIFMTIGYGYRWSIFWIMLMTIGAIYQIVQYMKEKGGG